MAYQTSEGPRVSTVLQTHLTTIVVLLWTGIGKLARKEVSRLSTDSLKKKNFATLDKAECVRLVASQSVGSKEVVKSAEGGSEYRLHLVMDKESFLRLRGLKAQLEASTEAEVIRRALKAYEIFEPSDDLSDHPVGPNSDDLATASNVEHLYVRIPRRTKDRLDFESEVSGQTYSQQVRQALRVFTQLTRETDALRERLARQLVSQKKGDANELLHHKLAASC